MEVFQRSKRSKNYYRNVIIENFPSRNLYRIFASIEAFSFRILSPGTPVIVCGRCVIDPGQIEIYHRSGGRGQISYFGKYHCGRSR